MRMPQRLMGPGLAAAEGEIRRRLEQSKKEQEKWQLTDTEKENLLALRHSVGIDALLRYLELQKDRFMREWYRTPADKAIAIASLQAKCHTYEEIIDLLTSEELENAIGDGNSPERRVRS